MFRRTFILSALAVTTAGLHAESFPTKPIRFVVPFSAGSTSDLTARLVGQRASMQLGQPLIVENVPGAGGIVGASSVVRSAANGYTIILGGVSINAANESLYKKLPYDMRKGFQPISMVGTTALALVVAPNSSFKSVSDLVERAKKKPGELSFGSGSASSRVAGEIFKVQGGSLNIIHVPYKGSAQALLDVMSGQVDFAIVDLGTTLPHIQSEKLHALAVTTAQRVPFLPSIPTLSESGLPNYDLAGWSAVYAPAGLPLEISKRLSDAFQTAMADKHVVEALQKVGFQASGSTPEALSAFTFKEVEKWASAIRAAGIEPE